MFGIDDPSNPFDNLILEATDDCPIKAGDRIFISDGFSDIEGVAMFDHTYPFDETICIHEDDGTELRVNGWQADVIEINGIEYEG